MPTTLTINNKKFFRELENGNGFNLNPTSFGTHLKGSVGNRVKMTADLSIYTRVDLQNYSTGNVSGVSFIRKEGVFEGEGLWVGDTITLRNVANETSGVITSINKDEVFFNTTPPLTAENLSDSSKRSVKLNTVSTDLRYNFNIQEQLESFDLNSLINESQSSFIVKTIGTSFVDGEWANKNKSLKYGNFKCRYVNSTSDSDALGNTANTVHNYKIEHEFIITPYWLDGWDLEGEPDEIFQNSNTLRYVGNFGFRRGYNNPNTQINGIDDSGLGSVGAIGQTFNDFENRYFKQNYVIKDNNGFDISGINVAETNKLQFTITNDKIGKGFLNRSHNFVATITKTPDFDKYKYSSTDDFDDVWGFSTSRGSITNGTQTLTGFFSQAVINIVDDQTATVELTLSFNTDYINRTENGDGYAVFFEVGDTTISVNDSDSINLLLDQNTFSKDVNITGLVVEDTTLIKRTSDELTTGYTDYKGWIQHGVNVSNKFSMNVGDNALIDELSVGIIAKKDNSFFDIYRYNFDLSTIVNNNGIQNVVIDESQNYKLVEGSIFNEIKLKNTGETTTGYEDYELSYGLKIPYQDWQQLTTAPNEFYNVNKELNGLNKNASNYIANGYTLHFFKDITASQLGTQTLYRTITQDLKILNFGEDDNNHVQWVANIQTSNSNGDDLGGSVLTNETTFIKATFTAPSTVSNPFGAIRIGENNHEGNNIDELTNKTLFPDNNRVIPLEGETSLKITQAGSVFTLECRTNVNQLENVEYIICAELFDANAVVSAGAYSNGYSNGYDN